MTVYLLANIGCLECGNATEHAGVFPTLEAAQDAAIDGATRLTREGIPVLRAGDDGSAWHWSGEGKWVVFVVDTGDQP